MTETCFLSGIPQNLLEGDLRDARNVKDTSQYKREADEDISTELLPSSLQHEDDAGVKLKSNEVRIGSMTRARAKLLKQ
jgi:hypothetical protein